MSTRTIYICDRCGKEYDYQGEIVGFHITQPLRDGTQEQLDLCPECQKLLDNIMHDPYDPYKALEDKKRRLNSIPIQIQELDEICYKLTGKSFPEIRNIICSLSDEEVEQFRFQNALETLIPSGTRYESVQELIRTIVTSVRIEDSEKRESCEEE